jgi:predicted RNA-binding Zn ribbon-like protein
MLPDEPGPVRLMATIWADTEGRHDDLENPSDVDDWLEAIGVDRHRAATSAAEFRHARELRDSLRRLAAFVTGDDRPAAAEDLGLDEAVGIVNAAAAERPVARLQPDGEALALSTETSIRGALAAVAAEGQRLLAEDRESLRACHAPGCVLYFVRTHHRREWCSVACGNRARAARHYRAIRGKK